MTKHSTTMELAARLIDLLKNSGGLEIEAEITLASPSAAASDSTSNLPEMTIELSGADTDLLLRDHAELLLAVDHIFSAATKLHSVDEQQLLYRVGSFSFSTREGSPGLIRSETAGVDQGMTNSRSLRASLVAKIEGIAAAAVTRVRDTKKPFSFAPMTSSERRILHKALAASELKSASSGEGFKRCVVLYPAGVNPPVHLPRPQHRAATARRDKLTG